jgi:uncharacterized coiled-coil DUF342 family protein
MEQIITIGGTIVAWLAAQKWVFPLIVQLWNWLIDNGRRSIDTSKELKDIEEKTNNTYEDQINFLVGQIDHLEKQLLQYSEQLEKLRSKILELNQKLFNKSMEISKLREMACCNQECKFRQYIKIEEVSN